MKHYLCPDRDFECPYFDFSNECCKMSNEGANPIYECDAFYCYDYEEIEEFFEVEDRKN